MRKIFTLSSLLLLLLSHKNSNAQFRKYSNEFLNIGAGARGLGMGGAQVASVKDGTASYWNPAGLVAVKEFPQINVMHAEYFAGIGKYDFGSLALPVKGGRTLGFSILRFAVDEIPNTVFLVEADGSINFGNITMFSAADYAFLFSLAQEIKISKDKKINGGINAKIIHRKAGEFATAWGFGFDAGVQFEDKRFKFGIVARDVTTTFNAWSYNLNDRMQEVFYVTNNEIPGKSTELTAPKLIAGGTYTFPISKKFNLLAEANLDITFDGRRNTIFSFNPVSIDPKLGLEGSYKDVFFIRAGINNFQKVLNDVDIYDKEKIWIYQPAVGAGFVISNVKVDYAFTNLANQSNPLYTHIFSLRLNLQNKD